MRVTPMTYSMHMYRYIEILRTHIPDIIWVQSLNGWSYNVYIVQIWFRMGYCLRFDLVRLHLGHELAVCGFIWS